MIQRIQSLWLMFAATASALMFFFPVIELTGENNLHIHQFNSISFAGFKDIIQSGYIVAGLTGIISLLNLVNIFLYKNRNLQMRICMFSSLLVIFLIGLLAYFSLSAETNAFATIGLSAVLPIIIFIFILMARRAVRRDDLLVRAADRLR
jgi:uncharacterized membrane protein YuzA (DUF378 family)